MADLPALLDWTADRLVHVHGEPANIDFVLALRRHAERLRKEESPDISILGLSRKCEMALRHWGYPTIAHLKEQYTRSAFEQTPGIGTKYRAELKAVWERYQSPAKELGLSIWEQAVAHG